MDWEKEWLNTNIVTFHKNHLGVTELVCNMPDLSPTTTLGNSLLSRSHIHVHLNLSPQHNSMATHGAPSV